MDLLTEVLNNTTARNRGEATILREEHNPANVFIDIPDFEAAATREIAAIEARAEWDASEYGISKAEAIARVWAANTPEARANVMAGLRALALARAGLDDTTGRIGLVTAGKLPWHKLGIHVNLPMRSKQALTLAGQNFLVEKILLGYTYGGKSYDTDKYALVRNDTGAYLGTVGRVYKPIQNHEAFEFLDGVLEAEGAYYESAGSLYGGKQVFVVAHLPKQRFAVNGNDAQEPFVMFTNPHNGVGLAYCFPTVVRVECANTKRAAMSEKGKGMAFRHTGSTKGQIENAKRMLGLSVQAITTYKEQAESLTAKKVEPLPYFDGLLDTVLDITAAQAKLGADALAATAEVDQLQREALVKSYKFQIKRRGELLDDMLARYDSEKNGKNGMRGTAWAAYNAVTEHADHNTIGRKVGTNEERASRRLE